MGAGWDRAQRRAVEHWRRIADGIGRRDPLVIVAELNETSALCDAACEEAGGEDRRCRHCAVFGDARACVDARLGLSSLVLGGETDRAREAATAIVERIAAAGPPKLLI